MNTRCNQQPPVETFLDYRRSSMVPPGTPRVYTETEIKEWAGQLGRKAARKASKAQPQKPSK